MAAMARLALLGCGVVFAAAWHGDYDPTPEEFFKREDLGALPVEWDHSPSPESLMAAMEGMDKAHLDSDTDTGGRSLLLMAAMGGHTAVIEALLQVGANPNVKGLNDDESIFGTPLIAAISLGKKDAALALIEGGADPNAAGFDAGPRQAAA